MPDTAATWTDPDFETQVADEYKENLDSAHRVAKRFGDAFAPHESAPEGSPAAIPMKVSVDAGWLRTGETRTEVAAQQTGTLTAPVSNPRIDLVYVDRASGAVGVVTGAEAGSPVAPALPAGKMPVALVALATSTTAISNQLITDIRALWLTEVQTADIEDSAVTTGKINDNAVTAAKIADGAITQAKAASGTFVEIDSDGGSPATFPGLRRKILPIGDWNMDSSVGVSITHGLTQSKIRSAAAFIYRDDSSFLETLNGISAGGFLGGEIAIGSAAVSLTRVVSGKFDSTDYNLTGFNRGWLTIEYDENG